MVFIIIIIILVETFLYLISELMTAWLVMICEC